MLPFGETVLAWRRAAKLTQADLAERAGIPRPNLSSIERGKRDVNLSTLRALAAALGVTPGVLVDGVPPSGAPLPMARSTMEEIATAAARDQRLADPQLDQIARWLRAAASMRLAAAASAPASKRNAGRAEKAWFQLKTHLTAETLASLLERMVARVNPS